VIIAVGHDDYISMDIEDVKKLMVVQPVILDLKGIFRASKTDDITYWSL
jgi:UDP-N-acetyl-D-mannosaminuronate dehydrogenase